MCFLGIDAGGTKTVAVCVDRRGRVLGFGVGGPGHHLYVGVEGLARSVREAIVRAGLGGYRFTIACLGLAGSGSSGEDPEVERALREVLNAGELQVFNDGYIALIGAFLGEPGIVTIAGTGSAVLALDRKGKVWHVGGWGHLLGDEGSACRIALDAIRAALQSFDGVREHTTLLERMLAFFGWEEPRDAIPFFYKGSFDKYTIARFAPLVVEEAQRGDRVAREVVEGNVMSLVSAVSALAQRADVPPSVAPIGGVFRSRYIRHLFREYLSKEGFSVIKPSLPPVFGAVWLALRKAGALSPEAVRELRAAAERMGSR
ncbi:N-acetylglucosamine kinase [Candidatus Bipolaricaulota sp. J31]